MGRDKAMVFLAGRTLLERAVGAVRDAGGVPLILGSPREAGGLAGVRFQDEGADGGRRLGPLNALRHGLRIGGTRVVVALACDLPLVPPALLRFLAGECERHAAVVPRAAGGLWAMTLDTRRTFDALVEKHASSEAARRRILENRFYQQVSSALAGSHEYMAMEKLLELSADERFDLVVLDTPPTRHALDFLEAPERLMGFLDTSVLKWFLKPYFVAGRLTLKVATRTGAFALELADRFLGLQFLQDLSEFFLAFEGMYQGFKERAEKVHALLRGEDSGFVLVAGPARTTLDEARYFYRRLREKDMPFVGLVVNRVHPDPLAEAGPAPRRSAAIDAELARGLLRLMEDQARVARRERRGIARLEADVTEPLILVPELDADVHDLRGLAEIGDLVLGGGRVRARRGPRKAELHAPARR